MDKETIAILNRLQDRLRATIDRERLHPEALGVVTIAQCLDELLAQILKAQFTTTEAVNAENIHTTDH